MSRFTTNLRQIYDNQTGTLSKRTTPGKQNDLEVSKLHSAVFEPNCGIIVGVVERFREIIDGESIRSSSGDQVNIWSVKNGVISKSDVVIDFPPGKSPHEVVIVNIDKKPTLVLSLAILPHGMKPLPIDTQPEKGTTHEIWETDILNGGTELTKQFDISKVVTDDTAKLHLKSCDNMLYVRSTNEYGRKNALHVYVDLEYKSKIAVPWDDSHLKITTLREDINTPSILNVSFSDKYVFVNTYVHGYCSTNICAYTWSPDNLIIGDMVFGPERASDKGSNVLLSSSKVLTHIDGHYDRWEFGLLGIYNVEDNTCNQIKFPGRGICSDRLRTFVEVDNKLILLLDSKGETFELSY